MVFDLVTLSSPSAADASLNGDEKFGQKFIILVIPMATTYCPHSLVTLVNIISVETTVAIVYGQRAGRRRQRFS